MSENKIWEIEQFPHCDARILHAPGECDFCDCYPEWQELREAWQISFTGKSNPDSSKLPCPAEHQRGMESLNSWPGNLPTLEKNIFKKPSFWASLRHWWSM